MDPFVQKLDEYGLFVGEEDDYRKRVKTIVPNLEKISTKCTIEELMELIVGGVFFLQIRDEKRFIEKTDIQDLVMDYPDFLLKGEFYLEVENGTNELFLTQFEGFTMNMYKSFEEKQGYYEEKYPEWKLTRVFDEEKADKELERKIKKEQSKLRNALEEEYRFENLYNDLLQALKATVEQKVKKEILKK